VKAMESAQLEQAIKAVAALNLRPCFVCDRSGWVVVDMVDGNLWHASPLAMLLVRCEHCGLTLQFSAVTLGLTGEALANEGDSEPDTERRPADKTGL